MASRKFKASWTPTPLRSPDDEPEVRVPPPPSPTLFRRAALIVTFLLRWVIRELMRYAFALRNRTTDRSVEAAQETREFCERMGGMWVILARLASLRGDLLGQRFCLELERTRDRAVPISLELVKQIIDGELRAYGRSLDEVFESIEPVPLSARSFGQAHRARLKNGRDVVVRVRLPDAVDRVETDWRWLRVFRFFMEHFDLAPYLRWDDLLFEVKKTADDLLDFRTEVKELRQIRQILRPRRIYMPEVFAKFSTEQMLVTEYVDGISVSDVIYVHRQEPDRCDAWLAANKIDMGRVWRRIFNAHSELLLEHNLFFTELSPGSILLLRNGRIAFVTLNTIGTMDAELLANYRLFLRALSQRDYTKTCDTYLAMGPALPYKDMSEMRQNVLRALRKWETRTYVKNCQYREKSIASAMGVLAGCAAAQELPTFWNLARLQLAERILEPTLEYFGHTKNPIRALARYERAAQYRSIGRITARPSKQRRQRDMLLSRLLLQMLENLKYDGDYLRSRLQGFQGRLSGVAQVSGRLLLMIGKFAMLGLVIEVFLYGTHWFKVAVPFAESGDIGRILSAIKIHNRSTWIVIVLLLLYFRRFLVKLAKQLFSPEVRPSDL